VRLGVGVGFGAGFGTTSEPVKVVGSSTMPRTSEYRYDPGAVSAGVAEEVWLGGIGPESYCQPPWLVTWCGTVSSLTNTTRSPGFTVRDLGTGPSLVRCTVRVAALACGTAAVSASSSPASSTRLRVTASS